MIRQLPYAAKVGLNRDIKPTKKVTYRKRERGTGEDTDKTHARMHARAHSCTPAHTLEDSNKGIMTLEGSLPLVSPTNRHR